MVRQRAGPNAARNGEDCMNHRGHRLAAALLALAIALPAGAAETVKIGVIYPLSGNAASAGNSAKDAIELGAEIVNGVYPELKGSPLAGAAGLANLGGAKVELLNADHQGNPSVGQSQTLRLVTQEKVAAMLGAYHSSVALTATAVAERYGVPFLVADSVALNITQRGFKWIFRSGPIAPDFAKAYTSFLGELKQAGRKVDAIAIVNENTDYGTSVAASIGDEAGFSDPAFIPAVGEIAQGAMNRSAWDLGKPGGNSYTVNELFKKKTGRDLDDTSARWMQGLLVLADAINRAGSTDPAKIQKALQDTDLKPEQLMIGYRGVKFDETGQNTLSATYLIQLQGKEYKSVWPQDRATAKLVWPMTGWRTRNQ